jgi:hypothetical protein
MLRRLKRVAGVDTEPSSTKPSTARLEPLPEEEAQERVPSRFGEMSKQAVVKMLQAERSHVQRLRKQNSTSRL